MRGQLNLNETKSNIRSIRFYDKVGEIIEGFDGDNFNDKFNNLVLYCFEQVPMTERSLEIVESRIKDKRGEYGKLCNQLNELETVIRRLNDLNLLAKTLSEQVKKIVETKV